MSDSSEANLQLKKRARRRLVGAIAFAGLAAVILPMVMDEEPKQQVQDVQIRIPGRDQTPFSPKLAKPAGPATSEKSPVSESAPVAPARPEAGKAPAVSKAAEPAIDKPAKAAEKAAEKPPETPAKTVVAETRDEPQRAAAILAGKTVAPAAPASGQYLVLIGAFSNPANVRQLQTKIGELGIKVITEPLDSPEGRKTRVRAGPFASREAAEKALERMKRIGVSGVVAAKQ